MKQDPPFEAERWKFGYLVDTVFTRDTWLHRLDIARATDQPMVTTADHDGRLVSDVVGEWSRRHGQPFALARAGGKLARCGGECIVKRVLVLLDRRVPRERCRSWG